MSFKLPVPKGFITRLPFPNVPELSWVKWDGLVVIDNGNGASDGQYTKHILLPGAANRLKETIQPHPKGGTITALINLDYKLTRLLEKGLVPIPELVDQDRFSFGVKFPYTFRQGTFTFGPFSEYTVPLDRGLGSIVQGSWEYPQKPEGEFHPGSGSRPYVGCTPLLTFKSAPGDPSTVSYQLPAVGGPSYTPPGGDPTPDGSVRRGSLWLELDLQWPQASEPTIDLDPSNFQMTIFYDKPEQKEISNNDFIKLRNWVDAVKASNLYPVIKNRSLGIHIHGHASNSGPKGKEDIYDLDLSSKRSTKIQDRIKRMIEANPIFFVGDRGRKDATPGVLEGKWDKNVGIFIERKEALAALRRYYAEGGKLASTQETDDSD
ncbi:MAG: hypothetical protein ABSH56_25540 [Bryobacteraceae bacterium]|jgi:hypothetical protein